MFGDAERVEQLVEINGRLVGRRRRRRRAGVSTQSLHHLFELRIVSREVQSAAVVVERGFEPAQPVVDLGHAADRGEIIRRRLEDVVQFLFGVFELVQLDERAPKGDARGKIAGMSNEAGTAAPLGRLVVARSSILLRELREGDRRRIALDAATEFGDARTFRSHGAWSA
jgi:hypothetical protein